MTKCVHKQDWKLIGSLVSKCGSQVVKINVFPMGDILALGDLTEGHSASSIGNLKQLRKTIKNTLQMSGPHHTGQNVPPFNFVIVRFQMVAVTLKMKPRSNMRYVLKSIVKGGILIYKYRLIYTNLL